MVLLQVRTQRVPAFKLECQTPGSIDVHRVTLGLAMQRVEIKAWHIHLLHRCGGIQSVQPTQDALVPLTPIGVDPPVLRQSDPASD